MKPKPSATMSAAAQKSKSSGPSSSRLDDTLLPRGPGRPGLSRPLLPTPELASGPLNSRKALQLYNDLTRLDPDVPSEHMLLNVIREFSAPFPEVSQSKIAPRAMKKSERTAFQIAESLKHGFEALDPCPPRELVNAIRSYNVVSVDSLAEDPTETRRSKTPTKTQPLPIRTQASPSNTFDSTNPRSTQLTAMLFTPFHKRNHFGAHTQTILHAGPPTIQSMGRPTDRATPSSASSASVAEPLQNRSSAGNEKGKGRAVLGPSLLPSPPTSPSATSSPHLRGGRTLSELSSLSEDTSSRSSSLHPLHIAEDVDMDLENQVSFLKQYILDRGLQVPELRSPERNPSTFWSEGGPSTEGKHEMEMVAGGPAASDSASADVDEDISSFLEFVSGTSAQLSDRTNDASPKQKGQPVNGTFTPSTLDVPSPSQILVQASASTSGSKGKWPTGSSSGYCHHCRYFSDRQVMICSVCPSKLRYCVKCITEKYHGIPFIVDNSAFICPKCEGSCRCNLCPQRSAKKAKKVLMTAICIRPSMPRWRYCRCCRTPRKQAMPCECGWYYCSECIGNQSGSGVTFAPDTTFAFAGCSSVLCSYRQAGESAHVDSDMSESQLADEAMVVDKDHGEVPADESPMDGSLQTAHLALIFHHDSIGYECRICRGMGEVFKLEYSSGLDLLRQHAMERHDSFCSELIQFDATTLEVLCRDMA